MFFWYRLKNDTCLTWLREMYVAISWKNVFMLFSEYLEKVYKSVKFPKTPYKEKLTNNTKIGRIVLSIAACLKKQVNMNMQKVS